MLAVVAHSLAKMAIASRGVPPRPLSRSAQTGRRMTHIWGRAAGRIKDRC